MDEWIAGETYKAGNRVFTNFPPDHGRNSEFYNAGTAIGWALAQIVRGALLGTGIALALWAFGVA